MWLYKPNLNKVSIWEIFVTLTCINWTLIYSKHKIWSDWSSDYAGFTVYGILLGHSIYIMYWIRVRVIVFNATFNNISVILWRSFLLVEETWENHRPAASHWQTLSYIVVSSTTRLNGIRTHNVSGDRHCIELTYHHWCCGFESRSGRGVQHYFIKFVSDLGKVGGFLRFSPLIELTATI